MADEAIIRGEYVEWKMVKTRKALQLVFEVPLEHQALVQAALGTPMPDQSNPVAICRLVEGVAQQQSNVVQLEDHRPIDGEDEPHKPPRPLSQVAAFLCTVEAFKRYIFDKAQGFDHMPNTDEATAWLKSVCQIESRRELDVAGSAAERRFKEIRAGYNLWLKDVA
jgi:hypothetical protein